MLNQTYELLYECIVHKLTKAKYPMGINYVHCDHLSNHTLLTKLSEFNSISVKWIYYENRYFKNIRIEHKLQENT